MGHARAHAHVHAGDGFAAGLISALLEDMFATEPLPLDSPLRTLPRVTALPHIGSATVETRHAMAVLATSNLLQALAGDKPEAMFDTSTG